MLHTHLSFGHSVFYEERKTLCACTHTRTEKHPYRQCMGNNRLLADPSMFEIGNEVDFVLSEAKRLRLRYPKIIVAPLLYKVEDNRLYLIREE